MPHVTARALLVLLTGTALSLGGPSVLAWQAPDAAARGAEAGPTNPEPSKAEQIVQRETAVEKDRLQLEELKKKLENHEQGEYTQAKEARKQLEKDKQATTEQLERARQAGETEKVRALEEDLKKVQDQLPGATQRFELAQAELDNIQKLIKTLEDKLAAQARELERLHGATAESGSPAKSAPPVAPAAAPAPAPVTDSPQAKDGPALVPGAPAIPMPGTGEAAAPRPPSEQEKKRAKEIAEQQAVLEQAEQKAEDVQMRLQALQSQDAALREGLDLARRKVESLTQQGRQLAVQIAAVKSGSAEHRNLQSQAEDVRRRLQEAEQEVMEKQRQLIDLQDERKAAESAHASAQAQAERERSTLRSIKSPFSLQTVREWLLTSGPKILIYVIGIILLRLLIVFVGGRISRMVAADDEHGTGKDRELRARTLVSVFQTTATAVVALVGLSMILQEFGISLTAFLGIAAIATVAVGFAAQSIVKDYFHGFLILLENQYAVDDVIRIAGIAGMVERITLRMTVLRDLEGVVHFVPNGQITAVSNMTHGWSRALFDIGVSYREDVDRVMGVLVEIGKEMRRDPKYSRLILADPEMLGVDAFGDSAVIIKFFIKTYPLQQWTIKREFNRRMKRRFDELGIEIPFPHRTIYHRFERNHADGEAAARLLAQADR
jgi:small conductance mechanosensitive channel